MRDILSRSESVTDNVWGGRSVPSWGDGEHLSQTRELRHDQGSKVKILSLTPNHCLQSRSTSIAESLYASTIMSLEEDSRKTRWTMNDQQWVLQRKKIGLSRRSRRTLHAKLNEERTKMSAITYIHTHFNRKECTEFSRKLEGPQCVHCHGRADQHKSRENLQFAEDEMFGSRILKAIKVKVWIFSAFFK